MNPRKLGQSMLLGSFIGGCFLAGWGASRGVPAATVLGLVAAALGGRALMISLGWWR